jgi:hypothetical protein
MRVLIVWPRFIYVCGIFYRFEINCGFLNVIMQCDVISVFFAHQMKSNIARTEEERCLNSTNEITLSCIL